MEMKVFIANYLLFIVTKAVFKRNVAHGRCYLLDAKHAAVQKQMTMCIVR